SARNDTVRQLLPDARFFELPELAPDRIHLRPECRLWIDPERQVVPVRADGLLALPGERGQAALLAELRRQVGVVLRPRVGPAPRRGKRSAHVAQLLEQTRGNEVGE